MFGSTFREDLSSFWRVGRSPWVVATVVRSLLGGISKPKVSQCDLIEHRLRMAGKPVVSGAPSRARTPQSARRLAGLFGLKRMRDSSLLLSGLQVEPGPVARNDSLGLRLRQRQTQGQRPGRHQRPKATATARHIDYEQRRARSDTARTEKGEMNELRANGERFVCRSNTQFQRVRPGPALRE
jgi:hypothetical protein